ncbi:RNA methyltransferase [Ferruginibacter yonginensis]|uniref:RNA methyltransferase n=1 Tax=Ferruginibacter yonginensis TaxID=1310416 RepID=A0ABV8QNK9_9BACT
MINKSTIKYIQSLQHKKHRDEHHQFIAEGPKVVKELLLSNNFECDGIYCTQKGASFLNDLPKSTALPTIYEIADFEFHKLSALSTPNHILAVFKKKTLATTTQLQQKLTLLLDDIQDPGNLGTIIRIADWYNIEHVFCTPATADCYSPKVVQSTMASLGRVHLFYTDLQSILQQHTNIKKYAAVLGGKDVRQYGKLQEGFLIIGNESKGISDAILQQVDEKITIPKFGAAESLNAAVATGIILFSVTG